MSTVNNIDLSEWSRAKPLRLLGYTTPQLVRWAAAGLIRSSHIRLPGQTRGIRLYHVGDLRQLVARSIEQPASGISEQPSDLDGPTSECS